ncbi:MAG: DUF177 domain-containing protein [Anaerolineaceae bacterium]
MTSPRNLLKINAGFLINQSIGTSREIHIDLAETRLSQDLEVNNLNGLIRLTRTPKGVLVEVDISVEMKNECVRCLAEFSQTIVMEFSEMYAFNKRAVSESGLILPDDGNIDLAPLVREYLLLEIPIRPLCKPDCKGLCMECGEDLNVTTCEHEILRTSQS